MEARCSIRLSTPPSDVARFQSLSLGIPEDELPHVTTRFYRGRHKSASGSGLGLAIPEMAARRSCIALHFRNRESSSGLQVDLTTT